MTRSLVPIISPEEASQYLEKPGVVLVDARGGGDAYERFQKGHLQGAVFVDLETQLSEKVSDPARGGRHPLPAPETFGAMLGKVGITTSSHVLTYDDKSGANSAARFWWMMMAAGHDNIQVIDGGYDAIVAAGLPVSTGVTRALTPQPPYPVTGWKLPVVDLDTVDKARQEKDHLVIDVRESYRYRGESEPIDLVAGHIPGAVNAPYFGNLEASGRFRSAQVLARQYRDLIGDRSPEKVIVHCGSGVTACHTLLALEFAGIRGARLYTGSWSEWSRRGKPIEKGPDP